MLKGLTQFVKKKYEGSETGFKLVLDLTYGLPDFYF